MLSLVHRDGSKDLCPSVNQDDKSKIGNPRAPLRCFNEGRGVQQRIIFLPQKIPYFQICQPQKIPTFWAYSTQKNPSQAVNCAYVIVDLSR